MRDEVNVNTKGYRRGPQFKIRRATFKRLKASGMPFYFVLDDTIRLLRDMYWPTDQADDKTFVKRIARERKSTQIDVLSKAVEFYLDITAQPYNDFVEAGGKKVAANLGGKKVYVLA